MMEKMREACPLEEIDYTFLMDQLQEYSSPRAKVTRLLKSGALIRVKKGIYLFGRSMQRELYSLEVLANKIYGPSYVSLEYALAYYGLIPEQVVEITSVTIKRKRSYETPIGRFSYAHLPEPLYAVGYTLLSLSAKRVALIATPEKALADLLYLRHYEVATPSELKELLFEDLRLDEEQLIHFDIDRLRSIYQVGGAPLLSLLIDLLEKKL